MGDGIIGLPGAEFDLSVLKVELDVSLEVGLDIELFCPKRSNLDHARL